MYTGLQHIHSYFAYLVLLGLVLVLGYIGVAMSGKKDFTRAHRNAALVALILAHLQLLFGILLYFSSPLGSSSLATPGFMKDPNSRLYAMEHPLMMIIAIILITIGYSKSKSKLTDAGKFRTIFWYYLIALILILARIPWNAWP